MTTTERWQLIVIVLILGWLTWLLAPVLTPFAIAALLAYLGDPVVDWLERLKLSRSASVSVVFVVMTLIMIAIPLLLVPMLERQVENLVASLPAFLAWFETTVAPWLQENAGIPAELLNLDALVVMIKQHWQAAGGIAASVIESISRSGMALLGWAMNLLLIPVVTFYLLRDWDVLVTRVSELIPRRFMPTVSGLARESDNVLGAFLRGQLSVMVALSLIYSIGLTAVGLDFGLLIGLLAGLVSFVPYLGAVVGMGAALIAALVQQKEWMDIALILGVFGFGQLLEGMLLTPWLVGDRVGLHPVAVIFAVLAGGQLFGFLGVLLALPVAAVIMVVLRYLHLHYVNSTLYATSSEPCAESAVPAVEADSVEVAPAESSVLASGQGAAADRG